jgi:hypothetical protein
MFGPLIQSSDIVSSSYGAAIIATLATAALATLGLSWVSERWRLPLALSGAASFASGLSYLDAGQAWLAAQSMSAAYRYMGWFTVHPMQVAAVFFLARLSGDVPAGVFWRATVAAGLMVLCRYLGDAGVFNATAGVLLSMAFWLYILGEMYFGAMAIAAAKAPRAVRIGYFWLRLIFTIGWAIYPILHFVDVVIGVGHVPGIIVLYTVSDLLNLIAVSLIVLAVASAERF